MRNPKAELDNLNRARELRPGVIRELRDTVGQQWTVDEHPGSDDMLLLVYDIDVRGYSTTIEIPLVDMPESASVLLGRANKGSVILCLVDDTTNSAMDISVTYLVCEPQVADALVVKRINALVASLG